MKLARHALLAIVLSTSVWPSFAADHFWNCTTPDGIKYADATQCDKGDTAVKVMKGGSAAPAPATTVQTVSPSSKPDILDTGGVCPNNPADCARADYGVSESSPRAQAISLFMRQKQCDLLRAFPERCAKAR